MSSEGIMRRARRLYVVWLLLPLPVVFAQTPAAPSGGDLDVTMRVIVDPDAKVPDEIVRRIPLPKPTPPATSPNPQSEKDKDKPKDPKPGGQGQQRATEARNQGREFGEQVSDQAKQRSEEARRNQDTPAPPRGPPNNPPGGPPNNPPGGPPNNPPGGPPDNPPGGRPDSPPGRPTPPPQPPGR